MYSNGRTTFFLPNHFILFPWQAYFWGVLNLYLCLWTVLHTFAMIVFGKVATKKVSKNTSTAAPSKASDWFLRCQWKKIQQQGWRHRFDISTIWSWTLIYFLSMFDLTCSECPKCLRPVLWSRLEVDGSEGQRSHQSPSGPFISSRQTIWSCNVNQSVSYGLEFVDYFLDAFFKLFY